MTDPSGRPNTPQEAWAALRQGNDRFVAGTPEHPNQDAARRGELATGQNPFAVVFGCGDSRLAAELIFDQGLGDLFVVRTAGHVLDASVIGSIEYATEVLSVPLVVVLGHDSCGAVRAAMEHYHRATMPGGYIRNIVERVSPSVIAARRAGATTTDEVEAEHVRQTVDLLMDVSPAIKAAVADDRLAVVGLTYTLKDGRASHVIHHGNPC